MTPSSLFDKTPRCVRCQGTKRLILGDGEPICRICVYQYGSAAGAPDRLMVDELERLWIAHADVVDLFRVDEIHFGWRWTDPFVRAGLA